MIIRRYCIFVPDKEKDSIDGRLRYRVKWHGNTVAFNVGYRVEIDKWSNETQRCKNNTTHGKKKVPASVINKEINRFEETVEGIFLDCERSDKIPTSDELRVEFNKRIGRISEDTENVIGVFRKFVDTQGFQNNWTEATHKKFRTLQRHLCDFDGKLTFATLTEDTLDRFIRHLLDGGMANMSIAKYISLTKWFLRWAANNGYYNGHLHDSYKPHIKGSSGANKEVIYLTWDELMDVYHFEFKEPYLERIRDVFCFCCFTGVRYSDVAALKRQNVSDDCINIVTQKTSDVLKIELNKYSKAILDKYRDVPFSNNAALPVISNQKMNVYLKEVGKKVGLDSKQTIVRFKGNERVERTYYKYELLTTHCGRRTFVVNALYLGIPSEVIMKWTGHSDYKSMRPYIAIVDDIKVREMNKFNTK